MAQKGWKRKRKNKYKIAWNKFWIIYVMKADTEYTYKFALCFCRIHTEKKMCTASPMQRFQALESAFVLRKRNNLELNRAMVGLMKRRPKRETTMSRRQQAREFKRNRVFNEATIRCRRWRWWYEFYLIWLPPNCFYRLKRCVFMWLFIYLYLRECVCFCLFALFPDHLQKISNEPSHIVWLTYTHSTAQSTCYCMACTGNVYLPK